MKNDFISFSKKIGKGLDFNKFLKSASIKENYPELREINLEIQRSLGGGKYIRPTMLAIGYLSGNKKNLSDIYPPAVALEFIHLAILMHDDIIDSAKTRRFKPTTVEFMKIKFKDAHIGASCAVLIGDILRSFADSIFLKSTIPEKKLLAGFSVYNELKKEVDAGQYLDVRLSMKSNMTKKDLEAIWIYKTAKYSFEKPLIIGATLAGASKKIIKDLQGFAIPLGMAFQIQDDILGTLGDEKDIGKSTESDIREGKKTLLIMEALKKAGAKDREFIKKILGNTEATASDIQEVRDIIIKTGAYDRAREKSSDFIQESRKLLTASSLPVHAKKLLFALTDYLLERKITNA